MLLSDVNACGFCFAMTYVVCLNLSDVGVVFVITECRAQCVSTACKQQWVLEVFGV